MREAIPDESRWAEDSLFAAYYMPRPRVSAILERAAGCKLVYVVAGTGYGKTQAVRHHIEQYPDAVVRWLTLTESDNVGSCYWEHLTHRVSLDNPDLAEKLRALGFPETAMRFKQFAEIQKSAEHRSVKTFLVLDDFHSIQSEQALMFAQRCANLQIPGACVILISRKEPEINAVSLFAKGEACTITEAQLRFTDGEIGGFLERRGISFSPGELRRFSEATKGWAIAVQLLSLVLKRMPKNLELALQAMKQNVFKLFETEAFDDFPENIRKVLVQLALVSDAPLTLLHENAENISLIRRWPQLASFMWFDSFIGDYKVHPLYLEFLQNKRHILSDEEIRDTYSRTAQWCYENKFYLDAMRYFAKLRQYKSMIGILLSYPFKMPYDTCEYFLNIIEGLDSDHEGGGAEDVLMLKKLFAPLLLVGMARYEEAGRRSLDLIQEWERTGSSGAYNFLYAAYNILAYIDLYSCTVTHEYNFLKYLKKSAEYFQPSFLTPVKSGTFVVADIRSFACLVGEGAQLAELGAFLDITAQSARYLPEPPHKMYSGYGELVACEVAFFKNQTELARNFAYRAIMIARENGQYSYEAMASQYLLRIAVQEGNYSLAKEILKQLRDHLDNSDFCGRQLLHDLFTGFFYAQVGLPGMAPPWLVADEKEEAPELHLPVRELIVSAKNYIALKKYDHALTILCNSYPREPHERFLFGELTFLLLMAAAKARTGDAAGAAADFEKAYTLSFEGVFEMPFVELGKDLRPLAAAIARREGCTIPKDWLKAIAYKASGYAKKAEAIGSALKEEHKIENTVQLSEREREVLNDVYHGLSREEIAANRYLSVNTVKKILQSIYIKLDANNNVHAVRIAVEKGLIG